MSGNQNIYEFDQLWLRRRSHWPHLPSPDCSLGPDWLRKNVIQCQIWDGEAPHLRLNIHFVLIYLLIETVRRELQHVLSAEIWLLWWQRNDKNWFHDWTYKSTSSSLTRELNHQSYKSWLDLDKFLTSRTSLRSRHARPDRLFYNVFITALVSAGLMGLERYVEQEGSQQSDCCKTIANYQTV